MSKNFTTSQVKQVEKNYQSFLTQLPILLRDHPEEYVLMKNGKVVEFLDTARDADTLGRLLFSDSVFSIQQVTNVPVDLGFFSHF